MKLRMLLLALAAGVVLSVTAAATSAPAGTRAASAVVPKVVGMRLDSATRALKAKGFRVFQNCGAGYECDAPKQMFVFAQQPRPGTRYPARTVITLYGAARTR